VERLLVNKRWNWKEHEEQVELDNLILAKWDHFF